MSAPMTSRSWYRLRTRPPLLEKKMRRKNEASKPHTTNAQPRCRHVIEIEEITEKWQTEAEFPVVWFEMLYKSSPG